MPQSLSAVYLHLVFSTKNRSHGSAIRNCGRGISQADWVKELKRVSSRWIKELDGRLAGFVWQSGYGVFSVSPSALEDVEAYTRNQEEHHRKVTFQDEFRKFLQKRRVEWDERYVWD